MGFTCGIVGLPNVGKSTLFNALTAAKIAAKNYPFCTIDPNVGRVPVPDVRLHRLAEIAGSAKIIPTTIEFVDIAGLVAGASKGEGLGNRFLGHIRETDAIAHVVRCFDDEDVIHVGGKVVPLEDLQTVNTELILADMESVERAAHKVERAAGSGDKEALARVDVYSALQRHLESGRLANSFSAGDSKVSLVNELCLITRKPVFYVANVAEDGFTGNAYLDQLKQIARTTQVIPFCAKTEAELAQLSAEERREYLTEIGLDEPGLHKLIRTGYETLELQTFFTAGVKEAKAWTISQGATAVQAAGKIHSDFARGFIRAEVVSYPDYVNANGEQGAKEQGKWHLEGKDYVMNEGDIVHFRFNV